MAKEKKDSDNIFEKIEKVQRLIRLMARDEGASISEMAKASEWSRWTIKRLIDIMPASLNVQELQDESLVQDKRETRWKIDIASTWEMTLPSVSFKSDEQELFSLLLGMAGNIPVLGESATELQDKIKWANNTPSSKIIQIPGRKKRINSNTKDVIHAIMNAIESQSWLHFEYYRFDEDENIVRTVKPLYLFIHDGNIYLRSITTYNEYIITFAIERFVGIPEIIPAEREINVPAHALDMPNDPFGPFAGDSEPLEATIQLDSYAGYYASLTDWPQDSVSIEEQDDGTYIMNVRTRNRFGLINWIVMQQSSAVVLSPPQLRNDIKAELEKMLEPYKEKSHE